MPARVDELGRRSGTAMLRSRLGMPRTLATIVALGLSAACLAPVAAADTPLSATTWCPIMPLVTDLDGARTRYAVALSGVNGGPASGTLSLYSGDQRFDVPFANVTVVATNDATSVPTPIVVRFAAPTKLDGATMTRAGTCELPFSPWTPNTKQRGAVPLPETPFLRAARAATPVDAPQPTTDALTCAKPYAEHGDHFAPKPQWPRIAEQQMAFGTIDLLVVVNANGSLFGTRVDRSAGTPTFDATALAWVGNSRFDPEIFRCRPVAGAYHYAITFRAHSPGRI